MPRGISLWSDYNHNDMQSKTMLCSYLSGPWKRRKEARVCVGWFGHCGACHTPSSAGTAGPYQLRDNKEEVAALRSLSLLCSGSFMLPFSVSYKFLSEARDEQGKYYSQVFYFSERELHDSAQSSFSLVLLEGIQVSGE